MAIPTAPGIPATDRARAYVSRIPPAVSGQRGHSQTFAVACALLHGFALARADAWPIFADYCARCAPPWNLNEAHHKLDEAEKSATHAKPRGHLLGGGTGTRGRAGRVIVARPRPSTAPKSLGRVRVIELPPPPSIQTRAAAVLPPPPVSQAAPPIKVAHTAIAAPAPIPASTPSPRWNIPEHYCPNCWTRWARALSPTRCICTGDVILFPYARTEAIQCA